MAGNKDKYWIRPEDMYSYYVYALYDKSGYPFYIGKGKGLRVNNHTKPSSLREASYKNHKIKKILSEAGQLKREILFFCDSEESAFEMEAYLIESYGLSNSGGILTNVLKDHKDLPESARTGVGRDKAAKTRLKLSHETAQTIIEKYSAGGITQKQLAMDYGVSESTIGAILCKTTKSYSSLKNTHQPKERFSLTKAVVDNILSDREAGLSQKEMLSKYSVSKTHLYRIYSGKLAYITAGEGTSTSPTGGDDASAGNMENT